jgi:hypothetical protein
MVMIDVVLAALALVSLGVAAVRLGASDRATRDRLMNDVIPFLLSHHVHNEWFDEIKKR